MGYDLSVWLLSVPDGTSWMEVERVLRQSVLESMPLTGPDQQGVLPSNATGLQAPAAQTHTLPWDHPVSYAKQQLHHQGHGTGTQGEGLGEGGGASSAEYGENHPDKRNQTANGPCSGEC